MKNFFESPFKGKIIKDHIQNLILLQVNIPIIPDITMGIPLMTVLVI
jgi:hypothetical protein